MILAHRDLALGGVTWGWLESAFEAMALAAAHAGAGRGRPSRSPSSAPARTSWSTTPARSWSPRTLPHGRYVEIPDAFHEILMETDDIRAVFWREFDALAADGLFRRRA